MFLVSFLFEKKRFCQIKCTSTQPTHKFDFKLKIFIFVEDYLKYFDIVARKVKNDIKRLIRVGNFSEIFSKKCRKQCFNIVLI